MWSTRGLLGTEPRINTQKPLMTINAIVLKEKKKEELISIFLPPSAPSKTPSSLLLLRAEWSSAAEHCQPDSPTAQRHFGDLQRNLQRHKGFSSRLCVICCCSKGALSEGGEKLAAGRAQQAAPAARPSC